MRPLLDPRFAHTEVVVTNATLSRAAATEQVTVPAGDFTVYTITARVEDGPTTTWAFEAQAPHRLKRRLRIA